ncbi:MAG: 4-hydroxythreonine-4-phosphate dehydrogenase PdxA [Proteobacteria bacterium]|nr:4-hydroxythreonine-4-phosphate dehydrogenase PdxA [Pseudomonadota bacterium]
MWKRDSDIVLVTAGDPTGVGSEVIAKTLKNFRTNLRIIVIGEHLAFTPFSERINIITEPGQYKENFINLINMGLVKRLAFGKPTKLSALSAVRALETAVLLIKKWNVRSLVTAPIYKKGIIELSDYKNFTGHTEFLAETFKSKVLMMFYGTRLKVATVTTHIPLKDVPVKINSEAVFDALKISDHSLKKLFKIKSPRIALLGLNPHAGEEGKMGKEEIEIIEPVIKKVRSAGINVSGPLPADTALYKALKGEYDFVLGLYHDQVLPAFKTLYFDSGVNVTLGLPVIRTSPDHGTAFDIAGKGVAEEKSFRNALRLAIRLMNKKNSKTESKEYL